MKNESNALLDKINALKRGEKVEFEFLGFGSAFEKARTQGCKITRLDWVILTRFHPYVFVHHDNTYEHSLMSVCKQLETCVIHDWRPGSDDLLADDWVVL